MPVIQQPFCYLELPGQFLQNLGIGGIPGLGLFPGGEIELFEENIRKLLRGIDIEGFPGSGPYPVNVLIKNILWQVRTKIVAGRSKTLNGLIRNFWYSHIKAALSRADSLNPKVKQYAQLIKMLVRLVIYKDLIGSTEPIRRARALQDLAKAMDELILAKLKTSKGG